MDKRLNDKIETNQINTFSFYKEEEKSLYESVLDIPKIITRAEWKAEKANTKDMTEYRENLDSILDGIVIHHSLTGTEKTPKVIENNHRSRGFADIGYHFIINGEGKIFQGRELRYMGAHAGESVEGNNSAKQFAKGTNDRYQTQKFDPDFGKIGICMIGNFNKSEFSEAGHEALKRLLEYLKSSYMIKNDSIIGHEGILLDLRDKHLTLLKTENTKCPGEGGSNSLKKIRKQLSSDNTRTIDKYNAQKDPWYPDQLKCYQKKGIPYKRITRRANMPDIGSTVNFDGLVEKALRALGIESAISSISFPSNPTREGLQEIPKDNLGSKEPLPFIAMLDDLNVSCRNRGESAMPGNTKMLGGFIQYSKDSNDPSNKSRNANGFTSFSKSSETELLLGVDISGKVFIGSKDSIRKKIKSYYNNDKLADKDIYIKTVELNNKESLVNEDGIFISNTAVNIATNPNKPKSTYELNIESTQIGKVLLLDKDNSNPCILYGGMKFIGEGMKSYKKKFGSLKVFLMDNGNYSRLLRGPINDSALLQFDGRNTGGGNLLLIDGK